MTYEPGGVEVCDGAFLLAQPLLPAVWAQRPTVIQAQAEIQVVALPPSIQAGPLSVCCAPTESVL
jgi:hypothetical protein